MAVRVRVIIARERVSGGYLGRTPELIVERGITMTGFARSIAAAALGLLFAGGAVADTLELKDGRVLQGRFLGGTQALMRFSVNGEVQTFNVTEIVALTFTSDYGNPPPQPPPPAAAPPQAQA